MSELHIYGQPVLDLPQQYAKLQGYKNEIKERVVQASGDKNLGMFLSYEYSEIPLALLISVLRHVKHGQELVLVNTDQPQFDMNQLRLCLDTISLAHLLRLKPLADALINSTLLAYFLS